MRRLLLVLMVGLVGCGTEQPRIEGDVLVLRNITVIDGTERPPALQQDVVLRGDRIEAIDATGTFAYSDAAEVHDLTGRYLVPGFIDMHAHVTILPVDDEGRLEDRYDRATSEQVLRMLLASGITSVRNPAAPTADGVALREAIGQGEILGPRILTAGHALNRGRFGPFVATPDEAAVREEVRRQAAAGVDFIKVYAALPPLLIEAAVDEAHTLGLRVIGHLQRTTWTEGARFGIDALTHVAAWSTAYLPEAAQSDYSPTLKGRLYWLEHLDLYGPEVSEMIAALARHHVTIDPTLIALHTKFWGNDPRYRAHPDLRLVPPVILESWQHASVASDWPDATYRRAQATWPTVLALTKRLFDAGLLLTAGSDLPNPWIIPGVGFHEELRLLADAGIPPGDVLRIATAHGATALGLGHEIGTIEAGKRADLVVLTANPLDDLHHTRAIEAVLHGGVLHLPDSLYTMKELREKNRN